MSKLRLQVVFDREDRAYHFGEKITGQVILDVTDKVTCRKIWMDYGWRTHGKGNRDKGERDFLELQSEAAHFSKGEQKVYPFWFTAPDGPVTYHGTNINVDWYVTTYADIPLAIDARQEEDFLLLPGASPAVITQGNAVSSQIQSPGVERTLQHAVIGSEDRDLSKSLRDPFPQSRIWFIFAILTTLALGALLVYFRLDCLLSLIIFVLGGVLIYVSMISAAKFLSNLKLDIGEISISPADVHTGEELKCYLKFQAKGEIYLESIAALLVAEEVATSGSGTAVTTHRVTVFQHSVVKPYTEHLMAGRTVTFECLLSIPPTAPATFIAANNKVIWSLIIKITLTHWPSWQKTIPVIVSPA